MATYGSSTGVELRHASTLLAERGAPYAIFIEGDGHVERSARVYGGTAKSVQTSRWEATRRERVVAKVHNAALLVACTVGINATASVQRGMESFDLQSGKDQSQQAVAHIAYHYFGSFIRIHWLP